MKKLFDYQLHSAQRFKNMTVIPVEFSAGESTFDYLLSNEAYEKNLIKIVEKSESGSVPEIKVINKGEWPVLFLLGESLKGAKQNRTLNVSIMVPPMSKILIPVSCTERGRWRYTKKDFSPDDNLVPFELRMDLEKTSKLGYMRHGYRRSDQHKVWSKVDYYQRKFNRISPTASLQDVMQEIKFFVNDYKKHFYLRENQNGIIVFIEGRLKGFEGLSRKDKFQQVYEKILKSYISDAIHNMKKQKPEDNAFSVFRAENFSETVYEKLAKEFLENLLKIKMKFIPSVGMGEDVFLESNKIEGSALKVYDDLVHVLAFPRKFRSQRISDK